MKNIVNTYISGLKSAYYNAKGKEIWDYFEYIKHGATQEDLDKLKAIYPSIPSALINLLQYVDGTYWRAYGEEKITFFLLGSDVSEYPYYLLSSKQIFENRNNAINYYSDYINRAYEGVKIDEKITNNANNMNWLHFSDCMNNCGTSQLFIDFSPSEKGAKGQVIRFLHDPDEFKVIADSFDAYLKMLIETDFNFIDEEILE
ncbi:SMI1/KNR4 family protein [Formosa sp. L2A11]|uniref:SMI1/KNR4 family protein n=1 Tax=Formosa sp. L2A11 TaxID=2686363 RepID=UPI00131BE811|nr:SMI1/KNR4 family protein [Formosa sp. L2A11]